MRQYRCKPVIWAGSLEARNGIFACVILDLSASGAKLKLSEIVPVKQLAMLSLGNLGTFPCTSLDRPSARPPFNSPRSPR
jgi:hypothetical protein